MLSLRQMLSLAATSLLAFGAIAAPIASDTEYDCGGDVETAVVSFTVASVATVTSEVAVLSSSVLAAIQTSVAISSISSSVLAQASVKSTFSSTSVSLVASAVATASSSAAAVSDASGTKYMMIFGDSYSSNGFSPSTNTPTSLLPLGITAPGTTTSGGADWVSLSATQLNTSLTFALDYAVYGASTDTSIVRGSTPDLVDQVAEFSTYTADSSTVAWTTENTMAVFWIGVNDVGNSYWDGVATPVESVMEKYFAQLKVLYDAGVRVFTLFTVPPFDQAPVFASESTQGMVNMRANITAYNAALTTRLAAFEAANTGVTGTVFDTTASFKTVLASPSTYGAQDATCMNSDGTTCLWYDNYHPGQAIHRLVAENFVQALTGVFF